MNTINCSKHGEQETLTVSGEQECSKCVAEATVGANVCIACEG